MADKQLPLIELTIDESIDSDAEVSAVALVDRPAIGKNFLTFNQQPAPMAFASVDDEQQVVLGPAMIPDAPIYRNDENGEYFVTFSRDTVQAIALKFFEKGYQSSVNLMHDQGQTVDGVTFFMSFIKDSAKGIAGLSADDPEGTWYLGAKVKNPDVWAKVKAGEVKGFSVEGLFKYKKKEPTAEEVFEEVKKLISKLPI